MGWPDWSVVGCQGYVFNCQIKTCTWPAVSDKELMKTFFWKLGVIALTTYFMKNMLSFLFTYDVLWPSSILKMDRCWVQSSVLPFFHHPFVFIIHNVHSVEIKQCRLYNWHPLGNIPLQDLCPLFWLGINLAGLLPVTAICTNDRWWLIWCLINHLYWYWPFWNTVYQNAVVGYTVGHLISLPLSQFRQWSMLTKFSSLMSANDCWW